MIDLDKAAAEYVATPVVLPTPPNDIVARGRRIRSRRRRLTAGSIALVTISIVITLAMAETGRDASVHVIAPSQVAPTTPPTTISPTTTRPAKTASAPTMGGPPTQADGDAERAITTTFLGWIDARPHDAVQQYVQDYASIASALREGMAQHTSAALGQYTGTVDSITLVDATHATVRYSILFDGQPQFAGVEGEAIKIDASGSYHETRFAISSHAVASPVPPNQPQCPSGRAISA